MNNPEEILRLNSRELYEFPVSFLRRLLVWLVEQKNAEENSIKYYRLLHTEYMIKRIVQQKVVELNPGCIRNRRINL